MLRATGLASRPLVVALLLAASHSAWALSSQLRTRMRQACDTGIRDAPRDLKAEICTCYVEGVERKFPNLESEPYEPIRDDVRRVIPDCFAEAIARRDRTVNSKRGWPQGYRANYLTSCQAGATAKGDVPAETARSYCECTVRETEKRFPDSLSAEKYSRHLLADAATAKDQKIAEEVANICVAEASDAGAETASVEAQIIRYMRKGMTRANAARRVLRGYSGWHLMLTEGRDESGAPRANAEVERTKALIAEAGRLYMEACRRCAGATQCERDRIEALMPGTEDRSSPCGDARAPGEAPPLPMSKEEREALEKDAAPYVASMARGMLMGLVSSRQQGNAVAEKEIRDAKQGYLQLCERCTTRRACDSDVELILAGRAPEKRPWSRAARQ